MAFNGIGYFSIKAHESYRLDGSWPDGSDHGAQYFSAHPLEPDGKLVITEQSKIRGSDGRTHYGFRVTNEGPKDVHYNVQGGGFVNGFDVQAGNGIVFLGNDEDHGAQFCSANPRALDVKMVMTGEGKLRLHKDQIGYTFSAVNEPNMGIPFSVQGGGFTNGFNNVQFFTIKSGESYRLDGWSWPDGSDHGAQYFAADPSDEFDSLWVSEQNKTLGSDGRYYYGFRITNNHVNGGDFVNGFSVQGGGFE
jgi:hypothetical protein